MRWFDLRVLGASVVLLGACSDDGVPADEGATGTSAAGSASEGESSDPSGGTSAVTTATASDTFDTSPTTDPTGASDTDGTSGPSGSTGGVGTSGEDGSTGGGSSGTTGGTTEPECMLDEDCVLVDDCCSCTAISMGEEAPECDILECLVSTCTSLGLGMPEVACNLGTCEVEEVACNPLLVACDQPAPDCPDGQAPRVVDGCWGGCIPVEYCDVVPGCEACSDTEACVESVTQVGNSVSCVPIPPACEGVPSCDCMGEACEEPFDACSDEIEPKSGSELSCSCPAC